MARLHHYEQQWNEPSRSDYYVLRLIVAVRRLVSKNPQAITLENSKVTFVRKGKQIQDQRKTFSERVKEHAAKAKARWFSAVGVGRGKRS